MAKIPKPPVNKKLSILLLIFIFSLISIMLTDFITCKILFNLNAMTNTIAPGTNSLIQKTQLISLVLKLTLGILGFACFLIIIRQIITIISDLEKAQVTLKNQNLKIIRKSIALSNVMRQFEDQNYDLELSKKELKSALSDLKAKETDQRIIFDNSPLGIIRFDDQGEIKECNDKFVELMGSSREKLIGFNTEFTTAPEIQNALKQALKGEVTIIENKYTSITGGQSLDIRVIFNPVNPESVSTPVIASVEDISKRKNIERKLKKSYVELEKIVKEKTSALVAEIVDRKAAHAALQKSEERYRSILASIQDSYFELDNRGNLVFFNNSLPELLGYSGKELKKLNYKDYTEEQDHDKLAETFSKVYASGQISKLIHIVCIAKDGVKKNLDAIISLMKNKQGKLIGFQGIARDVTKQKIMEKRIQQARKMEAIGNLAGGIAHDFNNILGGIIGYSQLIKAHTSGLPKIHQYAEQIMKAGDRATELVRHILLFSRQTETKKIPSDMVLIAKEVIKLLRASIPSTIEIKHDFKKGLNHVMADPTQIHQVFMNLCSNASYAMKSNGGCLNLTLTNIIITKENIDEFQEFNPGEYIILSIADTGTGMDNKIIEKMFDPYFTTKEIGDGTGLGLATVHGIVKDHNGIIKVKSTPGKGTTFLLYFPAVNSVIKENNETIEIPEGNETILFVDDEIYLAKVGKEMFEDYGYYVDSTTNSTNALKLFEQNPEKYDLIITDYTMPVMTGSELVKKIRRIDPQIPIIMCTGISLEPQEIEGLNLAKLLMKPLDMDDMLIVVRKILDTQ